MAIWTSDGGGTTPGGTVTEVTATGSGSWISDNLVRVPGITMAEAAEIFADEASAHAATALQYRNETEEYASAAAIVALDIGAASAAAAMALASADEASDHAAIALDYVAQASSHAANALDYAAQALASADAASAVAATVASYASSIAFITVTQAVNLDTIESDTVANNAKVTNATHTGDVTGSAALTISNDVVSNAKLANMATQTIKGRTTAGTGDPEDLTAAQALVVLGLANVMQRRSAITNGPTAGPVTLAAGFTETASINLGAVSVGDIIFLNIKVSGTKGATAGATQIQLDPDTGNTATVIWNTSVTTYSRNDYKINGINWEITDMVMLFVTGAGNFIYKLDGASSGSDSTGCYGYIEGFVIDSTS